MSLLSAPFIVNATVCRVKKSVKPNALPEAQGCSQNTLSLRLACFQFPCSQFTVADIYEVEIPLMSPAPSGDSFMLCQRFCCTPTVVVCSYVVDVVIVVVAT